MKKMVVAVVAILGSLVGCKSAPVKSSAAASSSAQAPASTFKSFTVYTDRDPKHTHYVPSGYMGDSDLSLSGAYVESPQGQGPCLRATYKANGPKGWAGIYWQDPANNWGDVPGRAGYDLRGAAKLTFWARGENGGEKIHKFRMGGIFNQYPDSDEASLDNVRLTKEWKQYSIDLSKKDLRHIIAGFGFFILKADNPGGAVFYLDDIKYVGPGAEPQVAASTGTTTLAGREPAASAPAVKSEATPAAPMAVPASSKDLKIQSVESGLKVSFSSQLLFASGQATLSPESGKVLNQLIGLLSAYPKNNVLIEGHTDNTGDADYNLKLSQLRASAVRDYLISQGGFDAKRFQVTGYGQTRPIAGNKTKAGRSLNRRVEVTILKSS